MDETAKTFGQAAVQALTDVQASQGRSTKEFQALVEHKRAFFQMFRRWEILFKRADRGDVEADKWLIAEYYKSLGFLSPRQMDLLTEELKKTCTFFPTIKECLMITNPPRYSFSSPFFAFSDEYSGERHARLGHRERLMLSDATSE